MMGEVNDNATAEKHKHNHTEKKKISRRYQTFHKIQRI